MVERPRYWRIFMLLLPIAILGNAWRCWTAIRDLDAAPALAHLVLTAIAIHAMWRVAMALRADR